MKKNNKYILLSLLIIILISIFFSFYLNKKESFTNNSIKNNTHAFCFLCREPEVNWLDFMNTFTDKYDIFIVMDTIKDYSNFIKIFSSLNFIIISDEECKNSNYINSDYMFKPIVATDRAFYYFNKINNNYDFIWFCEDDVFFFDINTLKNLDKEYPSADLIIPSMTKTYNPEQSDWVHWKNLTKDFNNIFTKPWGNSLICLARMSKKMMKSLDNFVNNHKQLMYKEALFQTLALNNNMEIITPKELSKITWPKEWDILDIINDKNNNKNYIYHPVKDINKHLELRKLKY